MQTQFFDHNKLREALDGRTIRWLAAQTGIDYTRLHRISNGKARPTADDLLQFCSTLGRSATDFAISQTNK